MDNQLVRGSLAESRICDKSSLSLHANLHIKKRKFYNPFLCVFLLVIIVLLSSSSILAVTDSVFVGELSPISANVCGNYGSNLTISAADIWNTENVTLSNVTATLVTPNNANFVFISNETVSIGDFPALGMSSVNPEWTISCNPAFSGNYSVYVEFDSSNGYSGDSLGESISTIRIHAFSDINAPVIESHEPSEQVLASHTLLRAITDEDATCKYALSSGLDYEDMPYQFYFTGHTVHESTLTNLENGYYNYYVKCMDGSGNVQLDDYLITFAADLAPEATVSLEFNSPVTAGLMALTLTSSEILVETPTLKYNDGEDVTRSITLTGDGNSWTGFILISEEDNGKLWSFSYSGTDLAGKVGTSLFGDTVFFVDTTPPVVPSNLVYHIDGNDVLLSWDAGENEVNYYRIYHSIADDPLVRLDIVFNNEFLDKNLDITEINNYQISAVDKAGNEGERSEIISLFTNISTTNGAYNTSGNAVDATGLDNSEDAQVEIDLLWDDYDDMKNILDDIDLNEGLSDKNIVKEIGLKRELINAKNELTNLRKRIDGLELSDSNFNREVKEIKEAIIDLEIITPSSVVEESKESTTISAIFNENSAALFDLVLRNKEITDNNVKKKLTKTLTNFGSRDVTVEVQSLTIKFLDDSEIQMSVVNLETTVPGDIENQLSLIVEFPKDVVPLASDLNFLDGKYNIIKEDPVVEFVTDKNDIGDTGSFSFIIPKEIGISDLEDLIIIPMFEPTEFVKENSGGGITGLAVGSFSFNSLSFYDVAISITLIIVLSLIVTLILPKKKVKIKKIKGSRNTNRLNSVRKSQHNSAELRRSNRDNQQRLNSRERITDNLFDWITNLFTKTSSRSQGKLRSNSYSNRQPDDSRFEFSRFPASHSNSNQSSSNLDNFDSRLSRYSKESEDDSDLFDYYPDSNKEEYQKYGLKVLRDVNPFLLVVKANKQLNDFNFSGASAIHTVLKSTFKSVNLSVREKQKLGIRMDRLKEKLALCIKLNHGLSCYEKRDFAGLKKITNQLATTYNKSFSKMDDEEIGFFKHIHDWHKKFAQAVLDHKR